MSPSPDLTTRLGPLTLKNPVLAASGTFGYGLELRDFCPPEILGAVIVKGLSLEPWPGNPGPRMVETPGGLMNSIGLENMGVEAFLERALPPLLATGATVGVNILGHSPEDYGRLAARLAGSGAHFLEVNVSCPNVARGGAAFGADPRAVAEVCRAVREMGGGLPFLVKLTPLAADIAAVALAAETAGAMGVALINTIPGLAIDLARRRPRLGGGVGGLSGPAIKPVALRQVWLCARALKIPVVGLGGIGTAEDALEFILAGAAAVEVGTATLVDPRAPRLILEGLRAWLVKEGLNDLSEIRGALRL
ncbi:MAG: dihydroorotate dehydrogenase [Candidatus Adiutrix sp.]|jgi:dihydroorotate dehydrogenase (NAD+) catalytic subunit|nr:dihydroorotate dehydrogenase [Candidatus Adiutrix sp.]